MIEYRTLGRYSGATGPGTPAQLMEERVARLVEESVELAALVLDPEQMPLVRQQHVGIAQILLRCKLMLSVFEGNDVEAIKRVIAQLDFVDRSPTVVQFRR